MCEHDGMDMDPPCLLGYAVTSTTRTFTWVLEQIGILGFGGQVNIGLLVC